MDTYKRADKAEWIHDNYVSVFQKYNIGVGDKISEKQATIIKKEFNLINKQADKIFGK